MLRQLLRVVAITVVAALLVVLLFTSSTSAHGVSGKRFFPATIIVEDPFVADELSVPTVSYLKNGDENQEVDFEIEASKRITDHYTQVGVEARFPINPRRAAIRWEWWASSTYTSSICSRR
jgi:hypothetical protein